MSQWGTTGNTASNAPKWGALYIQAGSGKAAKSSNTTAMFQNSTPEQFSQNGVNTHYVVGQFAFGPAQNSNTGGENALPENAGWHIRRGFEGYLTGFTVVTPSGNTANGESILVSNGGLNGYGIITTNSSGNMASVSVGNNAGRFANVSVLAYTFTREKHMMNITVTTPGGAGANVYSNTDQVQAGNGIVNAIGTVTTTASGNLASVALNAGQLGLWSNVAANASVVFTILNANGIASIGTGGVLTANLGTSVGGAVTGKLGGRAGRVQYECLVAVKSIKSANTPLLPS